MDVLDLFVSPDVRVDDSEGFESVVDVRDWNPAVFEEAGREM